MSRNRIVASALTAAALVFVTGCASMPHTTPQSAAVHSAIAEFVAHAERSIPSTSARAAAPPPRPNSPPDYVVLIGPSNHNLFRRIAPTAPAAGEFTLGMFGSAAQDSQPASAAGEPQSAAATRPGDAPPGYWRPNLARQAGGEFKQFITHDLWRGFKTAFWDVENEAVLLTTLGASIAIRGTGVDAAIARRTDGQFELGCMDETIQIIGNPGTHFAGAGLLWLGSAITQDEKEHRVAGTMAEALCVNGITTMVLKLSTDTRAPDGDNRAWPSGHTSSAFTVAAVVNEFYGPLAGIPSLALAGLVGYQRIDSRVHDFSDVVFGAMLGYVVGTSIARDEKAEFPELFGMKVIPYSDPSTGVAGLALWKSW